MAEKKPQTYANHSRIVPPYHIVTFGLLVVYALWVLWRLYKDPGLDTVMPLLLAVAALLMFFYLRVFPLAVQDRLIRLEMRLRLREVLPEDLRPRIYDLSAGHLVALRFASDGELPDLVREVLDGKLKTRQEIKQKIKSWQPDYLRC